MDRTRRYRTALSATIFVTLGLAGCAQESSDLPSSVTIAQEPEHRMEVQSFMPVTTPVPTPEPVSECVDRDGDHHGVGCADGPDCNDDNASVTDECTRCIRPTEGCECTADAAPVSCGRPEAGACATGVRVCQDGRWSACLGYRASALIAADSDSCGNVCDPTCRRIVDCPTAGDMLPPDSTALQFGAQAAAAFCPTGAAPGGVTPACESAPGGPYVRSVSPTSWIDACAAAGSQRLLVSSDEGVVPVTIPFTFAFYGVPYNSARLSANGYVSFSDAAPQWTNSMLPNSTVPNSIFAFWDDLIQRSTGVCVATVGTAPNRTFVAEWLDGTFFPAAGTDTHLTFEVQLSEATSTVDVRYLTMTGENTRATGASATVGVQQGAGGSYDLVAYNTPNVTNAGVGFRWTPSATSTRCPRGVYRRVFEGNCPGTDTTQVPVWGALNYTAYVPVGSAIRFEVRAAETAAGLATSPAYRLPDAPRTTGTTAVPNTLDLGVWLRSVHPLLERARFIELRAYLDPGANFDTPPTLGSTEVRYNCIPSEFATTCRNGTPCAAANPCHRGEVQCDSLGRAVCADMGMLAAGTGCGVGMYCSNTGVCGACDEGAACNLSNACQIGRVTCASGSPQCVAAANRPAGTVCGVANSGNYTRDASAFGWFDACNAPGHTTVLALSADGSEYVTLPFPFRFYGTERNDATISANGYMAFPSAPVNWVNGALPESTFGAAVVPFWDDLVMREGVCLATYGASPDRLFVAQWSNADFQDRGGSGNAGARLNFEIVLEEASQAVSVIYGDMFGDGRATGSGATIGIQSGDSTRFNQVSVNAAGTVAPGTSFRWSPPISGICNGSGTCTTCTTTEVCDGIDNNCNALIDDAIADVSCGVGACRRTVSGCTRGSVPTCTPGAPTTEICNTIDDDCDGMVDEGCNGAIACPADRSMLAGDTTSLALTRTGTVSNIAWTVVTGPDGGASSAVWNPAPPTSATETFRPIIVGAYRIRATARDGFNNPLSCEFNVTAGGRGIRVELTWDGSGDLDLHMHNQTNTAWYNNGGANDCHYARLSTSWGAVLDVDNVTANGPENIRVNTPTIGADYTVAVHHYANGAGRRATVKIYCGAGTTPINTFVSAPMTGNQTGNCTNNTFWRVARINADSMGGCTVTTLNTTQTSTAACNAF